MDEETMHAGFTAGTEVEGVFLSPVPDRFATLPGTGEIKLWDMAGNEGRT